MKKVVLIFLVTNLIKFVVLLQMMILHSSLVIMMKHVKNMRIEYVFISLKKNMSVLRSLWKFSVKSCMKKLLNPFVIRFFQALELASVNSFAQQSLFNCDNHLSKDVIPHNIDETMEYLFNKLFAYGC